MPIFTGVQQAFGAGGCAFGTRTAVVAGATVHVTIPEGLWLCETDAHTTVQFTYDGGTTYVTQIAASSAGVAYSDGLGNVQYVGDATGGTGHRSKLLAFD